jgi:hypothetical protein
MGNSKKSQKYQGLRKYNRIVSFLVKDRKKKNIPYSISEIRQLASSIYPNFKNTQYSKINKKSVVTGKPTQKQIIAKVLQKLPYFPSELSDPNERYYWGIVDLLTTIQNATLKEDNLFFESDIVGQEDLLLQGGVKIEPNIEEFYRKHFKNFVNFLDIKRKEGEIDLGSGSQLRILATTPTPDKNGKWTSIISLTDSEGDPNLPEEVESVILQYNPAIEYKGSSKAIEPKQPKATKISASEQIELEKIRATENFNIERLKSEERIKIAQSEVEFFRLKKMDEYYQDALAGKITWERYDKLVDLLYKK